jgi:hypothetical protein
MKPDRSQIDIPVHPVADLFPLMSEAEFGALADDIGVAGLLSPIVRRDGVLIDGRNRYLACKAAGKEPRFTEYDESLGLVTGFIISTNARRRSLTEDQVVAVCAKAAPHYRKEKAERQKAARFKAGNKGGPGRGKTVNPDSGSPVPRDHAEMHANSTAGAIAQAAGVSRHKAEQALAVAEANPELFEKVVSGLVTLREAKRQVTASEPEPPRKPTKPVDLSTRFERAFKKFCDGFTDDELKEVKTILRKRLI